MMMNRQTMTSLPSSWVLLVSSIWKILVISTTLLLLHYTFQQQQSSSSTTFIVTAFTTSTTNRYNNNNNNRPYKIKQTTTQLSFFNFGNKPPSSDNESSSSSSTTTNNKKVENNNNNNEEKPDMIEKVFNIFFGQPEETPLGLKRFNQERFPEQYPATINEWAEILPSDNTNNEMKLIRPLLKNTNLEYRPLQILYNANVHGWSYNAFHQCVDKKGGGALVVCTTKNGLVCGGYNPKGWVGYGEHRGSIAAFLFVQNIYNTNTNKNQNEQQPFIKLRKVGGAGMAQMDIPESGPCFGADALVIPLNNYSNNNPKIARSKLGSYYERITINNNDGTTTTTTINSLFGKDCSSIELIDLKVYFGVYKEDEYIPYTDAEPFALT